MPSDWSLEEVEREIARLGLPATTRGNIYRVRRLYGGQSGASAAPRAKPSNGHVAAPAAPAAQKRMRSSHMSTDREKEFLSAAFHLGIDRAKELLASFETQISENL